VATEVVFLTAIIDALENHDIAVIDIPGAFMQWDLDDKRIHVRLTRKMVELLLEIDHELYELYLMQERGEMVMYVKLLKALYGTMHAA
jgi:translation elongation factor EF-G